MHRNCRQCRIREHCIEQNSLSDSIKTMIRNAFAAQTDTVSTWQTLQRDCLWVKQEEERKRKAQETSLLRRRLREVRQAKESPSKKASPEKTVEIDTLAQDILTSPPPPKSTVTPQTDSPTASPSSQVRVEALVSQVLRTTVLTTDPQKLAELKQQLLKPVGFYWLIVNGSQRHISLPLIGELVLGRFDLRDSSPLDVDLTYEDRKTLAVSRRHARIVGADGQHIVEDLGSTNGVFVNGMRIETTCPHQLQPGNCIALGSFQMRYDKVPVEFLDTFPTEGEQIRRFLFLTHTGREIVIAPPNNLIIGRIDPTINFVPSVDLSEEGKVAGRVSPRHARITWSVYGPCLKDLNSTLGTRLNGEVLPPNHSVLLKPGDHISLGGCVVAYDVEM